MVFNEIVTVDDICDNLNFLKKKINYRKFEMEFNIF